MGKKNCVLVMLRKYHINYHLLISDTQDSYNCDNEFKSNDCLMIHNNACFWGSHKFIPEWRAFKVVIAVGSLGISMIPFKTQIHEFV